MVVPSLQQPNNADPQPLSTEPVEVSVLIPVLNEEAHIRDSVAAMQAQRTPGPIELIFIDGGSRDATCRILGEVARRDPRIRVMDNPGRTTPRALNVGLRAARGRFVARMDAHTFYPPDYLAVGVGRLEAGDVDWVSGAALPLGTGRWSRRVELATNTRLGVGGATFRGAVSEEVDVDTGFTGVWRRATLDESGGWDEGWPINQDSELGGRLRSMGKRIVCVPEMAARYVPRNSLPALARQYARYGNYRAKTSRRHPATVRISHMIPPALVLTSVASLMAPGRATKAPRAALVTYAAAVTAVGVQQGWRARSPVDGLMLPAVFATMHLSWGSGFLVGCARYGPPLPGLRRVLVNAAARRL